MQISPLPRIRNRTDGWAEGEKELIEVPLAWGAVGVVLLPVWAAIGAIAALVSDCTIVVEKVAE